MSQLIGIGNELGNGAYKKAYKAIHVSNENESLFEYNLDINSLAVVSITFREYKAIKIEHIIEELKTQNDYANNEPQLAPKLYLVTIQYGNKFIKNILINNFLENGKETFNNFLDANKKTTNAEPKIYFLEELCGPTPGKKQPPLIIDDNFFDKVDELIKNLRTKSNLLFTDFKPQNTCPQYDASGNLTNIMALDLDLKFSYKIDDIKDDLNQMIAQKMDDPIKVPEQIVLDFVKDYMFIQFYYMLLKYATNLTENDKIFIKNKITQRIPPEKLLYQLSIFNVIVLMYAMTLSIKYNVTICLENIKPKFPIFKYVLAEDININVYNKYLLAIENEKNMIKINENMIKTNKDEPEPEPIMKQLFNGIATIIYDNYDTKNNVIFTDIVYIVNPQYKVSLEDLEEAPIVSYEETYSPINTKETKNKKNYTEKDADYDTDEDLFASKGGKRKTKKNRRNRRK